jgi:hypothetical protein
MTAFPFEESAVIALPVHEGQGAETCKRISSHEAWKNRRKN